MRAAAARLPILPNARSTTVTTGLNAADTGCRAKINATRTVPVAIEFASSCNPTSPGESRCAAIPDPTTAATRNPVPTVSAATRRARLWFVKPDPSLSSRRRAWWRG